MKRVQQITMEQAPWVFLFNPGYQLATRSNVTGYSWYTPTETPGLTSARSERERPASVSRPFLPWSWDLT